MPTKPLIYSCSGYSSAAQLANALAVEIDREGIAEMSCIAGVGGGVPQLVAIARSGRPIVVVDGCPLRCGRACLAREGIEPTIHVTLSDVGMKKLRNAPVTSELRQSARTHVLGAMKSVLPIMTD